MDIALLLCGSGSAAHEAVERLPGLEHGVHDDGELSRYRDCGALEPDLLPECQPPASQGAVGGHAREDRGRRLVEQRPQVRVTPARDMAVIVHLARLIAPGGEAEPGTHRARRFEIGRISTAAT